MAKCPHCKDTGHIVKWTIWGGSSQRCMACPAWLRRYAWPLAGPSAKQVNR